MAHDHDDQDFPGLSRDDEDPVEALDALMAHRDATLDGAGAAPPIGPDGGFAPQPLGEPPAIPKMTAANCPCLAGPCRYLIDQIVWFPAGNAEGSPGADSREVVRYCDRFQSAPINLTDELVFECSSWTPLSAHELAEREARKDHLAQIRSRA